MAELLTGLEIKGYRQFERFTMDGLRRVNLLVGRNNSGKTALLEAVQILMTRPTLGAVYDVLVRRGEMEAASSSSTHGDDLLPSIRHLYPTHRFHMGDGFLIAGDRESAPKLLASVTSSAGWAGGRSNPLSQVADATLTVGTEDLDDFQAVPATRNGLFATYAYRTELPSTRFVAINGLGRDEMALLHDIMLLAGTEGEAVRALQILEPSIKDVHFRSTVHHSRLDEGNSILLGYGESGRHPIGSAGEGMKRMLGLSLALNSVQGGVLLVDEIDTGLHYSVMGDLWRLVAETAKRLDVQVFATTHSLDCVQGLEYMRAKAPELFEEVAVHTIDVRRGKSVVAAGERLQDAVQLGVELR